MNEGYVLVVKFSVSARHEKSIRAAAPEMPTQGKQCDITACTYIYIYVYIDFSSLPDPCRDPC